MQRLTGTDSGLMMILVLAMKRTVGVLLDWLRMWIGFLAFVCLEVAFVYGILRYFGAV